MKISIFLCLWLIQQVLPSSDITCEDNPCGEPERCVECTSLTCRARYTCTCSSGYGDGYQCYGSPCYSSPCLNGGTCSTNEDSMSASSEFTCSCAIGFSGTRCEHIVLPCDKQVRDTYCKNGGMCKTSSESSVTCECECLPGFRGKICDETDLSCASNPCENGATCFPYPRPFACQCREGYTGVFCEEEIKSICKNDGRCIQTVYQGSKYSQKLCKCREGFYGTKCQYTDLKCDRRICRNGGICLSGVNKKFKSCQCRHGYAGVFCQENVYQSYLNFPRIHFAGTLQTDPATVNNIKENYDTNNFIPTDQMEGPSGGWNPYGTGSWGFADARVTRVCYSNGSCTTSENDDPMINARLKDNTLRTSAKLVDIDPDEQSMSTVYGWSIEVEDFFKGDFKRVACQYIWFKIVNSTDDSDSGAVYHSVLTNVVFGSKSANSSISRLFEEHLGVHRELSIRFNIDSYDIERTSDNFTHMRVFGSIGISGHDSPPHSLYGRMLRPIVRNITEFWFTPFVFENDYENLLLDFGNSLPIERNGSLATSTIGKLGLGVLRRNILTGSPECHEIERWIASEINYEEFGGHFYTTGIVNLKLVNYDLRESVYDSRVVLAQLDEWGVCKKVVLAEDPHGVHIHPFSHWVLRSEPEKNVQVKLQMTVYGRTPPRRMLEQINISPTVDVLDADDEPLPRISSHTMKLEKNGICIINIKTVDPKNIRQYIDGQLYGFQYTYGDNVVYNKPTFALTQAVVLLVWNKYPIPPNPNWVRHISPIFQQYANLYPVMKTNFLDLGNYNNVVKNKWPIIRTMQLDQHDPNFMPTSRNLSPNKTIMILNWLSADKPEYGYADLGVTVDTLKRLLQTALQLEHATIPPYLTGYLSIKPGYNTEVKEILRTILKDEMRHMAQVANVLNAIGGNPNLLAPDFVLPYPTYLPGGVHPDTKITVNKISMFQINDVYMTIEQPFKELSWESLLTTINNIIEPPDRSWTKKRSFRDHLPDEEDIALNPGCANVEREYTKILTSRNVRTNYGTIGHFYVAVLLVLAKLECTKQITYSTKDSQLEENGLIVVHDYRSAKDAILNIMSEGEGSSPCNPLDERSKLSHYFKFSSIFNRRHVLALRGANVTAERCNGAFSYTGKNIDFFDDGVWPIVNDPQLAMCREGSKAYKIARRFKDTYSRLLHSLQNVFDGNTFLYNNTMGIMKELLIQGNQLVQTPIKANGDPTIGPNMGPIYSSYPEQ